MTGRELICYILEHHLEDEPVFQNGEFVGYAAEERVAKMCGTGTASVRAAIKLGIFPGAIDINGKTYVPLVHIHDRKE